MKKIVDIVQKWSNFTRQQLSDKTLSLSFYSPLSLSLSLSCQKQAQNLCIDASVEQRYTKANKGKQIRGLLKSMKSLRTFESYEKV